MSVIFFFILVLVGIGVGVGVGLVGFCMFALFWSVFVVLDWFS
jgi:hypothetical protein